MKEKDVQQLVKLEASKKGARLWRNNIGATYDNKGNFIRYGLANESEAQNRIIKASDLIGIKPVVITQDMVGQTIGQFLCREIKHGNWLFNIKDERIRAQLAWINLIKSLGGDAKFTNGEESIFLDQL